jgi:hypothetical protein
MDFGFLLSCLSCQPAGRRRASPERRGMNEKDLLDWKRRLAELLREHPDCDHKLTGKIEINLNMGGITKIYVNKEIK